MTKNNDHFKEASATVRRDADGRLIDLVRVNSESDKKIIDEKTMDELFSRLRLRISLMTACNLWCVFCSNEGSDYDSKKSGEADLDLVIKMSDMLIQTTGLKSIDFSGGEPLLHSDFQNKTYKLIEWSKKYPDIRFSIHSNGINLIPEIVDKIKNNFSRIGFSMHATDFETWNQMTNLNGHFPIEAQRKKFDKMISNLDYLGKAGIPEKVFLKTVVMRGINDSREKLAAFLDLCDRYNFHPKFLEFEPQYEGQKKFIVGRKELFDKLEQIGCSFSDDVPRHNDPATYIPGVNFSYKNTVALHSIFGCGLEGACKTCHDFLCMFVKPSKRKKGLLIKPCAVLDTEIDLTHAIETGNSSHLKKLFKLSREYLLLAPGMGTCGWNKEQEYEYKG